MVWAGKAPPAGSTLGFGTLSEENLFCRALGRQRHYIKLILLDSLLSLPPFLMPNLLSWYKFQGSFQNSWIGQSLDDKLRLSWRFSWNFLHHHLNEDKSVHLWVKMIHLRQTELLFIGCQICTRPILFFNEPPLKNCIQFRSLLSFSCFAYFTLCSLLADLFVLLSLEQRDTRQR